MPFARSGTCRVFYELRGHPDHPALVLVRGLARSGRYWGAFVDALATRFRVVALDNRGVGHSDAPPPPYSVETMADDVAAVLDDAAIGSASVFGMSLGGMIAQRLALRHPDRVDALILGCTTCGGRRARRFPLSGVAALLRAAAAGPERGIALVAPFLLSERTIRDRPEVLAEWAELARREPVTPRGFAGQVAAAARHSTWAELPRIAAPALVITGDADRLIHPHNSYILAGRIPDARLELVPGAGHDLTTDAPEVVVDAVERFLQ